MRWLVFLAVGMLATACSETADRPVPRRQAYPRASELGTAYAVPEGLPLPFAVNTQATSQVEKKADGSVWLTIAYPAYGAVAYCTFTPVTPKTMRAVLDNRGERLMLNLAGAPAELIEMQGKDGGVSRVLLAKSASQAAVQWATANPRWVVSGTAMFPGAHPSSPPDSIAPMVDAISRDIVYALSTL